MLYRYVFDDNFLTKFKVIMNGFDWKMAGIIWGYSIAVFIVADFTKVYFYYAMDNENTPDIDIQKIKKEKKPFLPAETSGHANTKRKNYETKTKVDKKQLISLP
jgi:hypothetical protein